MAIDTNWYVITGGPSSGKTKVIEGLARLRYAVVSETARTLIDSEREKYKAIEEIRADEAEFQRKIFEMKIAVENELSPEQIIFFDRGIPDSIAYYQIAGLNPASVIKEAGKRRYRGIFFLEQLPYKKDYARVEEKKTVRQLNKLLLKAYQDLKYEVVRVPVKSIEERINFILRKLKRKRPGFTHTK